MKLSSQVLIGALFAVPNVSAYGSKWSSLQDSFLALSMQSHEHSSPGLGHVTIATIASRLVSPSTEAYFKSLLGNENDTYLSSVATWADSYKYTKAGHFSSGFHYIDAKDSPPKYCGVDFDRDCKSSGCVVTALQNYTSRLLDPSLPPWDRVMAAKFVVHFVGDIHQPLHAENVARGGNGIHVKWHGTSWNLHHVWDSSIAEEMNGGYHRNPYPQALKWGCVLADEILEGKFAGSTKRWLQGMDLEAPIDTAMLWANESNSYVCSVGEFDVPSHSHFDSV